MQKGLHLPLLLVAASIGWSAAARASVTVSVMTPSAAGPSSQQRMVCDDCIRSPVQVLWSGPGPGSYVVTFQGLTSDFIGSFYAEATPVASRGVVCGVRTIAQSGGNVDVSVSCFRSGQAATNTRFALTFRFDPPGTKGTVALEAYAEVGPAGENIQSYTATGADPVITHTGTGTYSLFYGGIKSTQIPSGTVTPALNVQNGTAGTTHCAPKGWSTTIFGTTVNVACFDSDGNAVNTGFFVYLGPALNAPGSNGFSNFFLSNFAANTVAPSGRLAPVITLKHPATGRYVVSLPAGTTYAHNMRPHVTAFNSSAICAIAAWDRQSVTVECSTPAGNLVDSLFSYQASSDTTQGPTPSQSFQYPQVSSTNFDIFDVGYGFMCGRMVTGSKGVGCIDGQSVVFPQTGVFPVAAGIPPSTIFSIAIDNVDFSATRVLVLGSDGVVRASSGDLRSLQSFLSPGEFDTFSTFAQPTFLPTGAKLNLKKIVVGRATADRTTTLIGFTSDGKLYEYDPAGQGWVSLSHFPVPANVAWQDISHGITGLYLLASNGTMYSSEKNATSAVQLPALPNGLAPVTMGGPFVITNAGSSTGYACNSSGVCDGDSNRFYQYTGDGKWIDLYNPPFPGYVSLIGSDPFLTFGSSIVDGRLFSGDVGDIFVFQYQSRIYDFGQY